VKVLHRGRWTAGFLDVHCRARECRIVPWAVCRIMAADALYFERPKSWRLLWNYLREIGPANVLTKVRSRQSERYRNEKSVSCGFGVIVEAGDECPLAVGTPVAFVAPKHASCADNFVLSQELIREWPDASPNGLALQVRANAAEAAVVPPRFAPELWEPVTRAAGRNLVLYSDPVVPAQIREQFSKIAGWDPDSGDPLNAESAGACIDAAVELLAAVDWRTARALPLEPRMHYQTRSEARQAAAPGKQRAVLFGYGNYAKTALIPNVVDKIAICAVHEVDPLQLGPAQRFGHTVDTCGTPRPGERYDVFFIASYHHTHTPLAITALQQDAVAVIEKPTVVSRLQLQDLTAAMNASSGRVFECYQRRYLPFNQMARRDLQVGEGEPVSYHCIVFEERLPKHHWYRWRNSCSRLVSNGSHWIDHFLHLNDHCAVARSHLDLAPDGTLNVSVILENGAYFTMVLTDRGSGRIGVQDYIELRSGTNTVKIINSSRYQAESNDGIIRRCRLNKLNNYAIMYREIAQQIVTGALGHSIQQVSGTAGLILDLEQQLQERQQPQPVAGHGIEIDCEQQAA
jgi:predicted dehydrogenase